MAGTLTAGTAIRDITPKQGVSLAGYPHHPRPNKGVHDPLYGACLFLASGETSLIIITLDIIGLSRKNATIARKAIAGRTGVPIRNIMISCSHSHSSPRGTGNVSMDAFEDKAEPDIDYIESVLASIVEMADEAAGNTFAASLGTEKGFCGREQGVGGNRRDPMGIADPEVWVIGVRDEHSIMRAVLVKYALHPTFLHSDNFLVSADYPGYIRKYIAKEYPETVFLFAQGTSGNQSPRYFRSGKLFSEAERVGTEIGKAAGKVLEAMTFSSNITLGAREKEIDIALRSFPDQVDAEKQVELFRQKWYALRDSGAPEPDVWNAELLFLGAEDTLSMLMLQKQGKLSALNDNLPVCVQVLAIGDTRIAALQGEIFVEYGLTIQYRSPFPKTFVIELANGSLPGYAATTRAYAEGGYETGASMLTGKSGMQMVEAAVELLEKPVGP